MTNAEREFRDVFCEGCSFLVQETCRRLSHCPLQDWKRLAKRAIKYAEEALESEFGNNEPFRKLLKHPNPSRGVRLYKEIVEFLESKPAQKPAK